LALANIAAGMASLVVAARYANRRGWWAVSVFLVVLIFLGRLAHFGAECSA
jgi:hypothetical protein